jgi:hypothetical protein
MFISAVRQSLSRGSSFKNSGFEVTTFDQLLKIAERVLSIFQEGESEESVVDEFDDDIPF